MTVPSQNSLADCCASLPLDNAFLLPVQHPPRRLENDRLKKQIDEMSAWLKQAEAKPKRLLKDEVETIFYQKNNEIMNKLTALSQAVNAAASQLRLGCQTARLQLRQQSAGWNEMAANYAAWSKLQEMKEAQAKSKPKPPPPGMYM